MTTLTTFTCSCGNKFDADPRRHPQRCPDCRPLHDQEYQREWRRKQNAAKYAPMIAEMDAALENSGGEYMPETLNRLIIAVLDQALRDITNDYDTETHNKINPMTRWEAREWWYSEAVSWLETMWPDMERPALPAWEAAEREAVG